MDNYAVEIKIRVVVESDNPGLATTHVVDLFVEHLRQHAPQLLKLGKIEATSYPAVNLFRT